MAGGGGVALVELSGACERLLWSYRMFSLGAIILLLAISSSLTPALKLAAPR